MNYSRDNETAKRTIYETIAKIRPADQEAIAKAAERQTNLAKPPGSLGLLEEISIRIAGMTGQVINKMDCGCVAVFCADNGVAKEGIASAPQSVTMAQTVNFTRRLTGVGALCKSYGSELLIVDMGVRDGIPEELYVDEPFEDTHKILNRRVRSETGQTDNIADGYDYIMSMEEEDRAIAAGIETAEATCAQGFDIMGVGEMGIGNTTTSAALLSAITGEDAGVTVGRGGGVNDEGFMRKQEIVDNASLGYRQSGGILKAVRNPDLPKESYLGGEMSERAILDRQRAATLDALQRMGGFEICAMVGAFLGAATCRMPVVIDGYISAVAALAAATIAPDAKDYMIASHKSYEKGYELAVKTLGLKPFMSLDMRLGEGSGCPIAFEIIKGACDVMANMATFEEAAINDGYLEEIRRNEKYQK